MNHYFPCYVNDLLGSMRWKMMNAAQRGAYWQLICWQMQSEDGTLPADVGQLSLLADLDLAAECNAIVMEAFPEHFKGRANRRAFKEWSKLRAISGARAKAGAKGGASRVANLKQGSSKCLEFASSKSQASAAIIRTIPISIPIPRILNPTGSAPSDAGASAPERKKAATIDFDGEAWIGITDKDREAWAKAYPACDLDRQIAAAAEWAKANPRKAKKNWRRFLANWLDRAQQKGGDVASARPNRETQQERLEREARAKLAERKAEKQSNEGALL